MYILREFWAICFQGLLRIGLWSVLRPRQHSIGYIGDGIPREKRMPCAVKGWLIFSTSLGPNMVHQGGTTLKIFCTK